MYGSSHLQEGGSKKVKAIAEKVVAYTVPNKAGYNRLDPGKKKKKKKSELPYGMMVICPELHDLVSSHHRMYRKGIHRPVGEIP